MCFASVYSSTGLGWPQTAKTGPRAKNFPDSIPACSSGSDCPHPPEPRKPSRCNPLSNARPGPRIPPMPPIVDISGVDFAYGSRGQRPLRVLEGIDLTVERGTTLGLIGPNGGGKTTLIRLLLGLLEPTRGTIRVDGLPPAKAVRRGDVLGYLPQNPRTTANFPLSVRQVVRLGLAGKTGMLRAYRKDDLAFADALLDRVGIAGQ